MKLIAIDPHHCGCTECLTGEYVPLENATPEQIKAMLKGKLADNTGETFIKTITKEGGRREVTVTGKYSRKSWSWVKYCP